jgi:cytochrome P450
MLIQAHDEDGTRLTDNDLIGQTTALFIAGHETTASALTWTLFLLDQHPQVLRDLLDELDGTLHGAPPTLEQLNALPLLDRVINESLRLLPPGLRFLRVNTAPSIRSIRSASGTANGSRATSVRYSPWPAGILLRSSGVRRCIALARAMATASAAVARAASRLKSAVEAKPQAPFTATRTPQPLSTSLVSRSTAVSRAVSDSTR